MNTGLEEFIVENLRKGYIRLRCHKHAAHPVLELISAIVPFKIHQYFPKSLKSLEVCVDGRFCPQNSILSFLLSVLAPVTSEPSGDCVTLRRLQDDVSAVQ